MFVANQPRPGNADSPIGAFSFSPHASSILRTLFQVPYPVTPLLATLTKTPGGWGYSSQFGTPAIGCPSPPDSSFPCFLPPHFLASLLRCILTSSFSHPIRHRRLHAIEKEQAAKKDKRDRERRSQQQQPGSLPSARNRPPESVNHPRHRVQSVQPSP